MNQPRSRRILIIDDNQAIHDDFRKILGRKEKDRDLLELEAEFFGTEVKEKNETIYELQCASQGEDGLELLNRAVSRGEGYDVAFVDMRMPPGWDGVETIERLWEKDPDLQVVICTAYSDYTWDEISERLGQTDQLLILKKPFDTVEVAQLAASLSEKRHLGRLASIRLNELEDKVAERTQKLKEVASRAEQACVAKSEFLANMSHELRTPLTSILGYAETFLIGETCENLSEEQSYAVDTIIRSGNHLLNVINQILDLSKIEAGKIVVEQLWCSPREICQEIMTAMLVKANEKGISLELEVAKNIPHDLKTDILRLKQILINLVGNAIKFTEHGSVVLSLASEKYQGVRHLKFGVQDTGIGINETKLKTIFDPFTQADGSLTRRFGGTGLGLTVSKRLAEQLGGDIQATSTVNQGSFFNVFLPMGNTRRSPDTVSLPIEPDPIGDDFAAVSPLNYRILLAEDEKVNQYFVSAMLKKAGARVDIVDDGKSAYEKIMEQHDAGTPYDVVLMDMQMPRMDGYQATAQLRQKGYDKPIIALTAHAMEGDRKKCTDAGCSDYTTKPIRKKLLFEMIHQWAR